MNRKVWKGIVLLAYRTKPLRILLIKNSETGNVTPISGALENSESYIDAAIREAKEEVDWNIDARELSETEVEYSFIFGPNKKDRVGDSAEYKIILCQSDNLPEPKATKDTKDPTWLEPDDALNQIKFEDLKELLKRAIDFKLLA